MRFTSNRDLFECCVAVVIALALVLMFSGCASFTEEYWQERYEEMTADELLEAKGIDVTVSDIWLDAQTDSMLVCVDGDCIVVTAY